MILVRPRDCLWLLSIVVALTLLLLLLLLPSQRSNTPKFSYTTGYDHRPLARRTTKNIASRGSVRCPPILANLSLGTIGISTFCILDSSSTRKERMELALLINSHQGLLVRSMPQRSASQNQNRLGLVHPIKHFPLSAFDSGWYPIFMQLSDILYAFTFLPRDINFVGHTNGTTPLKKKQNLGEITVDPSLYLTKYEPLFYAAKSRGKLDAFRVFGGSRWMILSKGLNGLDNLPRKLLMYFTNVAYPLESYFHTVLCNTPEFRWPIQRKRSFASER